jgi:hypothetical protein
LAITIGPAGGVWDKSFIWRPKVSYTDAHKRKPAKTLRLFLVLTSPHRRSLSPLEKAQQYHLQAQHTSTGCPSSRIQPEARFPWSSIPTERWSWPGSEGVQIAFVGLPSKEAANMIVVGVNPDGKDVDRATNNTEIDFILQKAAHCQYLFYNFFRKGIEEQSVDKGLPILIHIHNRRFKLWVIGYIIDEYFLTFCIDQNDLFRPIQYFGERSIVLAWGVVNRVEEDHVGAGLYVDEIPAIENWMTSASESILQHRTNKKIPSL